MDVKDVNLIELKNVKKSYDGSTYVIEDFSLEVKKGEFVTFLGPSGCGKTTILRLIGAQLVPDSGEILFDGEDISKKSEKELKNFITRIRRRQKK